ncbi:hypothetical protein B9G98_01860 [Wickerhamiella sorbophila]|uniref:Uncharacterized protein n=1 Tax=Wickerhamiella sorbophila TaxID=45607 RepID=A0A2T0FGY2_9ASCO|nr:hypothetical protein B9G98_01860 [Wickerhamiella sorbophila]PRT54240.1 hypothetical protein B9G98_01860 [Wickerhamiella sorbophila]
MLSRGLRTTGRRFYSDKPAFSVESFVSRIDALTKNRTPSGKKKWEISGKKADTNTNYRPRRPQQNGVNGKPAPKRAPGQDNATRATRPRAPMTRGPKPSAAPGAAPKPVAIEANRADSFAQPTFTGFTASPAAAKPLAKRRPQPFDRRRARKPNSGRARVAGRSNANNVSRATRAAEPEQGVLSGSQALNLVLKNSGSDSTGCIEVDRLDLRSISSSLVPSSVTYNTRVWSVLNKTRVSDKNVAELVERAVRGTLQVPSDADQSVVNALAGNRYLSADTRAFLSQVASGKITPKQISQQ